MQKENKNTVISIMKDSYDLGISIDKLIKYLSIVENATETDIESIIEEFAKLLERINKIWANENSKEWNNIKSICERGRIELVDTDGIVKSFNHILTIFLHRCCSFSVFVKSDLITALAGENNRDILLALAENHGESVNVKIERKVAAAMLESIYNNYNGGINNG